MTDALYNTNVADIVVPEIFTPYIQQESQEKSRLIQSGALAVSPLLSKLLAGGGLTFTVPSFKDLDNDSDNVATDATADMFAHIKNGTSIDLSGSFAALSDGRPFATGSAQEIAVRLERTQGWATSVLARDLAGADPLASIQARAANYWMKRYQAIFKAIMGGISKDNGANDSGDYAYEVVGSSFIDGVTNFTSEACLDATLTMGDSMDDLSLLMVHSVVYNRMRKNNLIDFIQDSEANVRIPRFLGQYAVILDDGMPTGTSVVRADGSAGTSGMYESWLFGPGMMAFGEVTPDFATEIQRIPHAAGGRGQEVLWSRKVLCMHPVGHAYIGTAPSGGPSNAASSNNLNIAGSWNRVYSERKQIPFARLITREA